MNYGTISLSKRHNQIDRRLRRELQRSWPDSLKIKRLKKLKLAIKDQLASRALLAQSQLA